MQTVTTTTAASHDERSRAFDQQRRSVRLFESGVARLWAHLDGESRLGIPYVAGRLAGDAGAAECPDNPLAYVAGVWDRLSNRDQQEVAAMVRNGVAQRAAQCADQELLNGETVEARKALAALDLIDLGEIAQWIGERRT